MAGKMFWNTVTPLLKSILLTLMQSEVFSPFRLVGGTALSLQCGHRKSIDIDLFTDATYGSIDFEAIEEFLVREFSYVPDLGIAPGGMGKGYIIGLDADNCVKLDVYYTTDPFMEAAKEEGGVRMATIEEILAMKVDVIQRGGRKKDFWDLHELMDSYSPDQMLALHKQRYPYTHEEELIRANFTNFATADDDFEPICLRAKYWELIKVDFAQAWQRNT